MVFKIIHIEEFEQEEKSCAYIINKEESEGLEF